MVTIDIIFNSVCALLIFAGAVSLAYYAEEARAYRNGDNVANTLGAAAVSS